MSDIAPDAGQVEEAPAEIGQGEEAPVDSGQGEEVSPFFEYEHDDGEVMKFQSPDELKKHFRDGLLRHSDYTRKTQELSEQRKQFDDERKRHEAERTASLNAYSTWSKIDERYKKDPVFRQAIQNAMKQRAGGNQNLEALLQQKLSPVQKKLEQYEKQRQQEEQRRKEQQEEEKAFALLEKSYEDFDRDSIRSEVKRLQELPPGDSTRALYELLYHSMKGRVTPAQMEKQIAERQRRNSSAKPPMSPSNASPSTQKGFSNFREALEAAQKES